MMKREIRNNYKRDWVILSIQYNSIHPDEMEKELQRYAKKLLDEGKVERPDRY